MKLLEKRLYIRFQNSCISDKTKPWNLQCSLLILILWPLKVACCILWPAFVCCALQMPGQHLLFHTFCTVLQDFISKFKINKAKKCLYFTFFPNAGQHKNADLAPSKTGKNSFSETNFFLSQLTIQNLDCVLGCRILLHPTWPILALWTTLTCPYCLPHTSGGQAGKFTV